jgi:hypothetical protein
MSKTFVVLTGGLGNQLFQYALGRYISLSADTELVIDDTFFRRPPRGLTPREYGLDQFVLTARHITSRERLSLFSYTNRGLRFLRKFVDLPGSIQYYREPFDRLMLGVREARGDALIDGFWQSELYFEGIEEVLRQDLMPQPELLAQTGKLRSQIQAVESVSLHVRRGDYTDKKTADARGICDLEYYQRAIQIMRDRLEDPHFFVFSDDQEWVSQHLKLDATYIPVVHCEPVPAAVDLCLMASCNHHIIANSTFSWWGAWLNPSQNKLVVRPSVWMIAQPHMNTTACPPSWISI